MWLVWPVLSRFAGGQYREVPLGAFLCVSPDTTSPLSTHMVPPQSSLRCPEVADLSVCGLEHSLILEMRLNSRGPKLVEGDGHESQSNKSNERFEVFTAVTMKNGVFWDVTWYFFAAYVGC
jgi:hypothetical protein